MIELVISSTLSTVILLSFGNLFCSYFFNEKIYLNNNYSENSLYGVIILSFLALLVNFFFPINKYVGSIVLLIGSILFFVYFKKTNNKKGLIIYILLLKEHNRLMPLEYQILVAN